MIDCQTIDCFSYDVFRDMELKQLEPRASRRHNRQRPLLDAAARLFNERGYDGASIRDIAAAVGMLPGSIYYHFASKADLLVAVHEEGIRQITESVERAIAPAEDPWDRLRAACEAHLEAILDQSDYASVVIRVMPRIDDSLYRRLASLRDAYENIFRQIVDDLPLPKGTNRKYFRLVTLGALNWTQTWFRPGREKSSEIANQIIGLLHAGAPGRGTQ